MATPRVRSIAPVLLAVSFALACSDAKPGADQGAAEGKAAEGEAAVDSAAVEPDPTPDPDPASTQVDPPSGGTGTETETGEDAGAQGDAAPLPDSFESVGVEVCDQYVADYVACINDKVPEDKREAQRRVVFNNIEAWRKTQASGGPSAAQGLQIGCRSAREQAKRETQAWACTW